MTRKILAICVALLLALGAAAEGFTAISAGGAHALAVDEKGNAWAWGSNVRGESVPGNTDARVTQPVKVLENVVSVACGRNFSLALTSDGALYGWGDHRSNQLPGASDAPVLLREGVLSMDACEERAVLVTETGEVYAWGAGEILHLLCENAAEAAVGVDFILARLKTGEVYEYPDSADSYDESGSAADPDTGNSADGETAGGAEASGNGDTSESAKVGGSESAGDAEDSAGDDESKTASAENSANVGGSESAGGAESSANGGESESADGVENSAKVDGKESAGGAKGSGDSDLDNVMTKASDDGSGFDRRDAGESADDEEDSPSGSLVGVKMLERAAQIDACGQTRMARTEDGTLYIWGAAGTDGRLGLSVNGWVDVPTPLALTDVRTFSAGLTASGAITESGEAYLWGTVYSYVVLYDETGDPAASVVDGPLVFYGSTPVWLYDNAQALAFGDAFVLLLRSDGTILAWGSNDHGQMADGDWTKAEVADGEDEDEKDVVITESDQFVFPAVIMVPAES
ncbi:MAG: hypothetical protein Q4E18_12680 [Clostridia bacterium]|nr:hypothetical protein [Clostridia bacterium]